MTVIKSTSLRDTAPIVFVDHSAEMGGAEYYLLDVIRHIDAPYRVVLFDDGPFVDELKAIGADVSVVQAPGAVRAVRKKSGPVGAGISLLPMIPFVRALSRAFADARVVYLNSQKALIAGAPAARLARKPAVWNLHDIITAEHFGALNRRAAVAVANRFVTRVIANSHATKAALLSAGYKRKEIDVVYNGIDHTRFRPIDAATRLLRRKQLGFGEEPVVGLFGRIARWKGQDVLIRALPYLPDVRALIVGGALFQDDKEYLDELAVIAVNAGVQDRVMFAGSRNDVELLMPICDVIAHTSTAPEPFGRVIAEAMFCGVPVIATKAGGALEIVYHDRNGILVETGYVEQLVDAISRLLSDTSLRNRYAENGLQTVRSTFTVASMNEGIRRSLRLVTE